MTLKLLSVAYPFAPVSADPVGGAEQVLARLELAVVAAGGVSVVIAAHGSSPAGRLEAIAVPPGEIGPAAREEVHAQVRARIVEVSARWHPDVIHLHGVDFHDYLPEPGAPILATLHLPLAWYPPRARTLARCDVWLTPVSQDQVRRGPPVARMIAPIENGVEVEAFTLARKRSFALCLGRMCPEKGFHLALDAARAAEMPLLLAGSVFPYADHIRYFEQEIAPRLDSRRRWIGPVAGAAKRRLIAAARCLVVPSLVPETSSLVAREALAAGTPVVALRNGALVDAIETGRTGVLVDDPADLAHAMAVASALDPQTCRREAARRFDARDMVAAYLDLYARVAAGRGPSPAALAQAA